MSTPKFDALTWTVSCGCSGGDTKAVAQVKRGKSDGLLLKVITDNTIRVSEWTGGVLVRDAETMTITQVEQIL